MHTAGLAVHRYTGYACDAAMPPSIAALLPRLDVLELLLDFSPSSLSGSGGDTFLSQRTAG
jgi:hypothetical protein